MAEYIVKGETLESIADKIRVLDGIEGALTTSQMDRKLGEANDGVATEASLIAQIASALEGKAANGGDSDGIPEFSTVRVYLKDIHLSDFYISPFGFADEVKLFCDYIDNEYKIRRAEILFENNMTDTLNKSEAIFIVPTNSTIILDFSFIANHYVDSIVSSVHNELHNMQKHSKHNIAKIPKACGGREYIDNGESYDNIPIWGDTEIRISEPDN